MKRFLLLLLCACPVYAGQNIVIVLDNSGSMGRTLEQDAIHSRMDAAKNALQNVIKSLPDDTQLGMILLNGDWNDWCIPLGPLNKDLSKIKISELYPTGGTPLGGAIKAGCDQLLALRQKQKYGTYILLVVTDGEANDPSAVEEYVNDINTRGINLHVIGLDMQQDHSLARKVDSYQNAYSDKELASAISKTFAETALSDKNTSSEDFDALEGLPDAIAMGALAALANFPNYPIGEKPPTEFSQNDQVNSNKVGQQIVLIFVSVVLIIIVVVGAILLLNN